MPDIDLEPHEYRREGETRSFRWLALLFAVLAGIYMAAGRFDIDVLGTALFSAFFGACLLAGFPRYFWQRND